MKANLWRGSNVNADGAAAGAEFLLVLLRFSESAGLSRTMNPIDPMTEASDSLVGVEDIHERRRIQNRIAQRRRSKLRDKLY